jgi:hypothetical protein
MNRKVLAKKLRDNGFKFKEISQKLRLSIARVHQLVETIELGEQYEEYLAKKRGFKGRKEYRKWLRIVSSKDSELEEEILDPFLLNKIVSQEKTEFYERLAEYAEGFSDPKARSYLLAFLKTGTYYGVERKLGLSRAVAWKYFNKTLFPFLREDPELRDIFGLE